MTPQPGVRTYSNISLGHMCAIRISTHLCLCDCVSVYVEDGRPFPGIYASWLFSRISALMGKIAGKSMKGEGICGQTHATHPENAGRLLGSLRAVGRGGDIAFGVRLHLEFTIRGEASGQASVASKAEDREDPSLLIVSH